MTDRPSDRAIAQAFWEWEIYQPEAVAKVMDTIKNRAREIDAAAPDGAEPSEWRLTDRNGRVIYTREKDDADWFRTAPGPWKVEPLYPDPPSSNRLLTAAKAVITASPMSAGEIEAMAELIRAVEAEPA